ncbi:PTS system mannose/fructose/N-acetylgalactosamine-transporter subunit IIB [Tractidigestivibacter sp.]|uniref:PTS sugar transporter subunit IIB n=1 Tax=Tractidigestivibacter sp. TaxID=2847320 RepID=UPI002A90C7E9|nr:PTS system mannose/fructose/N-acetylgalactosamine-transporter subunit IIB [Tractidigestivibacter sp.]MCI6274112.1 PTS sugar transporter subunit IIB [Coriobacteriaceae bacterium]MDY5271610.1 PTS system mannose/fructose/N-acetylgalactosamine-transporter subunit IIB [Tractidigestivibacter sp.]
MAVPNIVMTRIDERLIHGQGQLWIRSLGVNTVIVVDDAVAGDHMQQAIMKTVVPKSVALRFFTVQKTIDIIGKAAPAQVIFLIVKTPQDALRLVAGGVPIREINVGNIHNAPGKEKVTRSIFLDEKDKEAFREMSRRGVVFNTRTTPSGTDGAAEVDITKYL